LHDSAAHRIGLDNDNLADDVTSCAASVINITSLQNRHVKIKWPVFPENGIFSDRSNFFLLKCFEKIKKEQ